MAEFPKKIWLIGTGTFGYDAVWCDDPKPDPGIDDEDVVGPYVLGADEEIDSLRQRVAELETTCAAHRDQLDMADMIIKERGERMKWLRAELKKYCKIEPNYRWFDPETGEPL